MKKTFLMVAIALAAVGCCKKATIEGAWGEKSPCPEKKVQGFVLNADGTAQSIHMKGLCLENWKQEGDLLILSGTKMPCPPKCDRPCPPPPAEGQAAPEPPCKATCEGEMMPPPATCPDSMMPPMSAPDPIAFADTLTIQNLTADSLILVAPCGHVLRYARLQCDEKCCGKEGKCGDKPCCKEKCEAPAPCEPQGCDEH